MSETTLQKVEAEVQKLTSELESVEQAQVKDGCTSLYDGLVSIVRPIV